MMSNTFKTKLTAFSLALVLIIGTAFSAIADEPETTDALKEETAETAIVTDINLENDNYSFGFNSDSGEVYVTDKSTGYIWRSNPVLEEESEIDSGDERNKLLSQILVYYYDEQSQLFMDSYSKCINLGNELETSVEGDTLSVKYQIGENEITADMLPVVMTKESMENDILSKLSEDEQEDVLKRYTLYEKDNMDKEVIDALKLSYPIITEKDIYVRGTVKSFMAKTLYELFQKAGYSTDDLDRYCEETETENVYVPAPYFNLTLEYTLTDKGLTLRLDPSKMEYTETYKPNRIELLPYFGMAGADEEGYMLVPDGSGAVIEFNNGKLGVERYWYQLFGTDGALNSETTAANHQESVLPFFAISKEQGSFIASIDEGYETAGISALTSGMENSYNYIYSFYDLFVSDSVSISTNQYDKFQFYSENIFSSPITINYIFTNKASTYSELAKIYREHLQENGVLPREIKTDDTLLNVEFTGTATVDKKFLGIPYTSLDSLTTFSQAEEILKELEVENTNTYFSNSLAGGYTQEKADNVKPARVVGNKKGIASLSEVTDEFYMSYYAGRAAEVKKSHIAKALNNNSVRLYRYDPISRGYLKNDYLLLITPSKLQNYAKKIVKSANKYKISSLNIMDLGYSLNSDFGDNYADRHSARLAVEDYLKTVAEACNISVEKGSIFSLKYADKIRNIPITSSGYKIEDYAVPFYQLVISGLIPYSAPAINLAADARDRMLTAVSMGAQIEYSWIHSTPDNVKDRREKYYGRNYSDTIDQAREFAEEYSELTANVSGAYIEEHIIHNEDVTETVWSNGVRVLVNFSDKDTSVNGVRIQAEDFAIIEKGAD